MGNSRFQDPRGRNAATGASSMGCVGNKGFVLAPQVGLEPTTLRLTAECSTIELLRTKIDEFILFKQTGQAGVKREALR